MEPDPQKGNPCSRRRTGWVGLLKLVGTLRISPRVPDLGCGVAGFGVSPAVLGLSLLSWLAFDTNLEISRKR